MFNALDRDVLYKILKLMLRKETQMGAERGLTLEFSESAVEWMLAQNDEPEYGARPLRRIIRRSVREPLADFLLRANPPAGTKITVNTTPDGAGLQFGALVNGEEVTVAAT
jgi:ATP-dependent Clp protease ATP-binding subunit ClpC